MTLNTGPSIVRAMSRCKRSAAFYRQLARTNVVAALEDVLGEQQAAQATSPASL